MVSSSSPKGSLTLSSPTSSVPGSCSPLTSYAVWPTISGCWHLHNPEHLTLSKNTAGNEQGQFSASRLLLLWQPQHYREWDMPDLSPLSQTFKAKLELVEFLPRAQGDGPQTSHTEEGDGTQSRRSFQHFAQENLAWLISLDFICLLTHPRAHTHPLLMSWAQSSHTSGSPPPVAVLCQWFLKPFKFCSYKWQL